VANVNTYPRKGAKVPNVFMANDATCALIVVGLVCVFIEERDANAKSVEARRSVNITKNVFFVFSVKGVIYAGIINIAPAANCVTLISYVLVENTRSTAEYAARAISVIMENER